MNTQNGHKHQKEDDKTFEDEFDASGSKESLSAEEADINLEPDDEEWQDILLADNNAMPELDYQSVTDSFNTDSQAHCKKNIRSTTRFVREDITTASITVPALLGFSKTISVELIDVACKGVLISTDKKLSINKKTTLTLQFKSGKVFVIKATVVHRSGSSQNKYGLKFDRYNNELGDYLLETQEKLLFK
jgi:hypothetical protein